MKKPVIKFFIKIGFLSIPLVFILILYFTNDPFRVLYSYSSYYDSGEPCYITLNRDYMSTETFIQKYPKYKYNSFIFGNSRSLFYRIEDWKKHISSDKCFHFNASSESIYGIYKKIVFLKERDIPITNALVVIDNSVFSETTDSKGHLFMKHPKLTGKNKYLFQLEFLKAFYSPEFLKAYILFKIFNIKSQILDYHIWDYNCVTNEVSLNNDEKIIEKNREAYYNVRKNMFFKRDTIQCYTPQTIKEEQKSMLFEILKKFKHDNTVYKIIISPLYDQKKINFFDLSILYTIFGKENVYDYSGINDITNNIYNYYETSHYRPHITKRILNEVYQK